MRKLGGAPPLKALVVAFLFAAGPAVAQDKAADSILKAIGDLKQPEFDSSKRSDQSYIQSYLAKRTEFLEKRRELILDLYKAAPNHPEIAKLMTDRWRSTDPNGPHGDDLIKEVNEVITKTTQKDLKLAAVFAKAQISFIRAGQTAHPDMSVVEEFIKLAPTDERAPQLLAVASQFSTDKAVKAALEERLLKEFPDSKLTLGIKATKRQHEGVGKPFDLEFADAITGSTVSIKNLKGKVVLLDFWATWCPPCVAAMPHMKELYAKYKDKGVEFIGVSLDNSKEEGGLDELKKFVKEKKISWPQYYQGKGWESEFSMSWGINSIPCVFVVDADGKLFSVDAGRDPEKAISEALKGKTTPASAHAGAGGQ
jgi:thiol-disulfide isomerase/thioredoxin